jgi:ActR/RegA family two-component response regulator
MPPVPARGLPEGRVMVAVRPNSGFSAFHDGGGAAGPDGNGGPGENAGRLNLLLSCGGWEADPWIERLPRLLEPMGVRSFVAGSGKHASDVIKARPIHIAVVDLSLPLECRQDPDDMEEGGTRLLELLAMLSAPPPTVVVRRPRTHRDDCRALNAALRAGAFAVIDRPRDANDMNMLLEVLRRVMMKFYRGEWPEPS